MEYMKRYQEWCNNNHIDEKTKKELTKIKNDKKEIEERFYTNLAFGTGGLRGIIGAGTNRMNIYTVGKATQGLAEHIKQEGVEAQKRGVVIAYDPRHKSGEFAMQAAKIFAANGIKAYIFDEITTTPELSFSIRELKAISGIVITASHNPPEYNGYKAYWEDGGQLPPAYADKVQESMNRIDIFKDIKVMEKDEAIEKGLIEILGEEIKQKFLLKVKEQSINPESIRQVTDDFKVIYTPFHGTGNKPVRKILEMIGLKNVIVVKEQEDPDPEFSTVKSPNPEEKEGFTLAIELAKENNADLIIGTDPDCDRIGVVIKDGKGNYINLTGNQVGVLLTEYILSQRIKKNTLPKNAVVIKTIVTTEMARQIANEYKVEIVDVYTGFKFFGEKIKEYEKDKSKEYIFGFEESYGYLVGTYVRDKDGVVASMLVAELAAWYKSKGMTLYEALMELYDKYGVFVGDIESIFFEGKDGIGQMNDIMERLRTKPPKSINGVRVSIINDYKSSITYNILDDTKKDLDYEKANVLRFTLADKSWFAIRPSGTEPKIKIYFEVIDNDLEEAKDHMKNFKRAILNEIKPN